MSLVDARSSEAFTRSIVSHHNMPFDSLTKNAVRS